MTERPMWLGSVAAALVTFGACLLWLTHNPPFLVFWPVAIVAAFGACTAGTYAGPAVARRWSTFRYGLRQAWDIAKVIRMVSKKAAEERSEPVRGDQWR